MNFEMSKSFEKGKEVIMMVISPSDELEKEFLKTIFRDREMTIVPKPGSDDYIIKPKELTNK